MYFKNTLTNAYMAMSHQIKYSALASCLLAFYLILFGSSHAQAQQKTYFLHVKPQECIILHKGQTCYVDIDITWGSEISADHCLYMKGQEQALACWQNTSGGNFTQQVEASESLVYELRQQQSQKVRATGELSISWVYKIPTRQRLAWRLF